MCDKQWVQGRVAATLKGDTEAYGELVRAFQSSLRGFVAMLGVPAYAIEELAQETFVTAFHRLDTFQADRSFGPWLRGIARNRVRQWRDRNSRELSVGHGEIMDFLMSENLPYGVRDSDTLDRTPYLLKCLEKLPEHSRHLVDLKYFTRMKSREIADQLGMEAAAVRMALYRIRGKLRDCIQGLMLERGAV